MPEKNKKPNVHGSLKKIKRRQPSLESILEKLRGFFPELSDQYGVSYLGLFGSFVRGEQKRLSDLDVLVEFSRTPTLFEFVRLERTLKDILGIKVDLVMKSALKPALGPYILNQILPV